MEIDLSSSTELQFCFMMDAFALPCGCVYFVSTPIPDTAETPNTISLYCDVVVATTSRRRRVDVATTSRRRRDVANVIICSSLSYLTALCRIYRLWPKKRRRNDVATTSQRRRDDVATTSRQRRGSLTVGVVFRASDMATAIVS